MGPADGGDCADYGGVRKAEIREQRTENRDQRSGKTGWVRARAIELRERWAPIFVLALEGKKQILRFAKDDN